MEVNKDFKKCREEFLRLLFGKRKENERIADTPDPDNEKRHLVWFIDADKYEIYSISDEEYSQLLKEHQNIILEEMKSQNKENNLK